MNRIITLTILLLLTIIENVAHADYQDNCVKKFETDFLADTVPLVGAYYTINKCVLSSNDNTEIANQYHGIERLTKTKDDINYPIQTEKIRKQISEFLQQTRIRLNQSLDSTSDYPELYNRQAKLTSLINAVANKLASMIDTGESITSRIKPDTSDGNPDWYSTGDVKSPYYVTFKDIIIGNDSSIGVCRNDSLTLECTTALESMADWLRFQNAASGKIHEFYSNAKLFEFQNYTVVREKMWINFFKVTNYPLPWESAFNQSFEGFRYSIGEYGLAEPPSKQMILLRPSLGAGFTNGIGQSPTPELILEVLGITKWKWEGYNAINRWGVSLIGTLGEYKQSNDTKSNAGIGLLLHTPKKGISLGLVAREHGKSGLIVTFDLINLWDERKDNLNTELYEKIDGITSNK